ncbi:PD-(D/E)XK nuclease family protein (plasmid) [Halorientalis pallida]|uniref:PD-(D/E)XK nuclease family protein n=1 Tax=Halorientalis pallida TaxID=2479928 RepID=UPI003C6FFF6C
MPIQRAKPPEQLYADIAAYDRVIVPDAPLASAINRRIDHPHFGTFAIPPRRLAAGRREQAEDRLAFLEVVDQTEYNWQAIAYAIGNVLQCWEHQGTIDALLDYDAYVDEATQEVVEVMSSLQTTSQQLTEYTIEADDIAVVGYDQLTTLERSILPAEYDQIDLFTNDAFDPPAFHIFDSPTEIVDALLDTITAENADNVAVVLDSGSHYSSLVESAFEAADIPFYGGPGFIDDPHHRAFVQLLRTAFRGSATTVGDVRPVLTQMGQDIPIDHTQKRLDTLDHPTVAWIQDFTASIHTQTFAEALADYEHQTGIELTRFDEELQTIGLADHSITSDAVDDLAYYLQTYEVPVDRENEGVLLADAKSSGYVDRPVVFYLGLDQDWTHSAPQRPWVDTDAQFDRYLRQFQLLLQSGAEQYYLVQDTSGGQPVTPCLYFGDLLDEGFDRFSDLDAVTHTRPTATTSPGFEKTDYDVETESVETISQSSLNTYVNSPRDYFFSRLLDIPDQERFVEGNLFHDFAEFYVTHPAIIEDTDLSTLVDVMLEEAAPFVAGTDEPLTRRKYRIGLETIIEYLDEYGPTSDDFLTPASGWGTNFFAEYFHEPVESPLTERWFENSALGIKGKIDLVQAPDQLLDYKSGRQKSAYSVVKNAAIDPPGDTPNFQAALYLSHYRTRQPDEPLEFTFFHFLETLDDIITGDADIEDTLTTISYYPFTFDEYVGSREAYDELVDHYNDCTATFEDVGYSAYSDIMAQLSFPDTTEKDELRASTFATEFSTAVGAVVAEDIDHEKGCDQAIRKLNGIRQRTFFREDLDAFEAFIDDRLAELNQRRAGDDRFPIEGPGGEPNYRRVDNRDLLLEGDR